MNADDVTRYLLLLRMPMHFNSLVIEVTTRCTAKCAMCYQAAGPKGSDRFGDATLEFDVIAATIRDAIDIPTLHPRVHITGGEAFISVDQCIELFQIAHDAGFLDLSTTTNAYWARTPARALDICERLRQAGMTTMEISWDHWHQPFVKPDAVSNCLDACRAVGIESNLRLLSTRSHTFEEAISELRPESIERANRITCGPVFPTGRASKELDIDDLYRQGSLDDNCHTYLNLTVNALGNVFPCCAGMDQTNTFIFGNVKHDSIVDVAAAMNRSPMLRTIVFGGIGKLAPIIRERGVEIGDDFHSICHMCWSIFSRPDCVEAVRQHFAEIEAASLRAVAERFEAAMAISAAAD